jgi:hypothetical protein
MQRAILQAYDDLKRETTWPQMTGLFVYEIRDRVYAQYGVQDGEHPSPALCASFSRALRTLVRRGVVVANDCLTSSWTIRARDRVGRIARTTAA